MGVGVQTAFASAKTTYTSAKTLWDNYVAILTKNSKVDAFAAAFAPPKAPTVPPLPAKPWLPDVSATMYKASQLKATSMVVIAAGITSTVQPTTQEFWINGSGAALATGGGWGSFTAATINWRNAWGKSYGTIGYGPTATTGWNAMGAVYDQTQ